MVPLLCNQLGSVIYYVALQQNSKYTILSNVFTKISKANDIILLLNYQRNTYLTLRRYFKLLVLRLQLTLPYLSTFSDFYLIYVWVLTSITGLSLCVPFTNSVAFICTVVCSWIIEENTVNCRKYRAIR